MDTARRADLASISALAVSLLGAAFLYRTVVPGMVDDWLNDPNFSHGLLVPLFSAWLIYERRAELKPFPGEAGSLGGLSLVAMGLLLVVVGKAGGEFFLMRLSIVLVTAGLFRQVFGAEGFRKCRFPIAFLFFMIPVPYILYDSVAFPLKMVASWFGEHSLNTIGVPVFREGNIIVLPNLQLEVADACSGIRSLMSLLALAAVSSHLFGLGTARGVVLFLSAVPVSVATNFLRIFLTGVLSYRFGQVAAEGFFHEFSGWIVFLAGALLIFLAGLLLRSRSRNRAD